MSIKVQYDLTPLEKKFGPGNVMLARNAVANQVLMDSEKYVPSSGVVASKNKNKDKGHISKSTDSLRASGRASKGSVSWNTVYARAQFFGTNGIVTFRKYTTPDTGSKWTEKASNSNMKKWEEVAKKGLDIR